MNSANRFEMLKRVSQFILANPRASFPEAVESLKAPELSNTQFYNVRAQLRKKGKLIDQGAVKTKRNANEKSSATQSAQTSHTKTTHIEILDVIDMSGFSKEIKEHYTTGILPLLQRMVPEGKNIRLVFLSDPPSIEIRRIVA